MKLDYDLRYALNQIKKNIAQKYGTSKMIEVINVILNESSTEGNLKQAVADLKLLVDSESKEKIEAVSLLGTCYLRGIGVAKDEKLAFELFTQAAEQGYVRAQCIIGGLYGKGIGVPKNIPRSHASYTLAASQGYAGAQHNLGDNYIKGIGVAKDEKRAAELFTLAARQGFPSSQQYLGVLYRDGTGVAKDEKQAAKLFTLAAGQGFPHAQGCLAICYDQGMGVAKDEKRSHELYTLAVEAGNEELAPIRCNLAHDYWYGSGVSKNPKRAILIMQAAVKHGFGRAENYLKVMYDQDRDQYYPDLEIAAAYYDSCKQEDPSALTTLAFCYQMGLGGVSQNITKAIELYHEALKQNIPCHWDLFICYRILSSKDETKPLTEFYEKIKQAHKKGNEKASLFFAYLHEYAAPGLPEQNLFTAHQCYLSASKKKPSSTSARDLKEIKENVENREIEFEIDLNTVDYVKQKLPNFVFLYFMQYTIQNLNIVIPNLAKIIAEYAFEADRVTEIESIIRQKQK